MGEGGSKKAKKWSTWFVYDPYVKKYFDFETILTSDSFDAELSMAVNNKSKAKITTDGTQVIEFQKKISST